MRPVAELEEWKSKILPNHHLTPADRIVVNQVRLGGRDQLDIDDLTDGVRVSAHAWAGFLRFPSFDISITPKLAGDNMGLVEMIAFTTGLDALKSNSAVRTLDVRGANLLDLICRLFVDACSSLLRRGLRSDYVTHEEQLGTVRGRLLADKQVLTRFGLIDKLECRFDEHETDITDNQLLTATLDIAAHRAENTTVRRDATVLATQFSEFCDPSDLNFALARAAIAYDRLNDHYRAAHQLAWLILDGLGIDDVYASGPTESFAFLIDMDLLFERFIYELVVRILDHQTFRVSYQQSTRSIIRDATTGKSYAAIRPDVVVTHRARNTRVAVDAKYKKYDEKHVAGDDISQSFLYAYAFGSTHAARAVLLYPATIGAGRALELEVRKGDGLSAARISAIGLHVPTVLSELQAATIGPTSSALRGSIQEFAS
jgi:5-methylcytosine-specific restriction enzyme subunit McrC